MRAFLAALLLLPSLAFAAPPTLDSTCTSNACFNQVISSTTLTVSASSTSTNDIIVVGVQGGTASAGGTSPSFTVSGCGLSWTRRSQQQGHNHSNYPYDAETWWAFAASALSACTITGTSTLSLEAGTILYFAVHGAHDTSAPFDTNINLPNLNANDTNSNVTRGGTLSTTEANDFTYSIEFAFSPTTCGTGFGTPFGNQSQTGIGGICEAAAAINFAGTSAMKLGVTSVQTSQPYTFQFPIAGPDWQAVVDAITGDAPPATGRSRLIQ